MTTATQSWATTKSPPSCPQLRSTTMLPSPTSFDVRRCWCGGFRIQDHIKLLQQKNIFDCRCGGKLLLIVQTGAGKTHFARLTATLVGGIAADVVLLLTLTTDLIEGLRRSSNAHGSVEAHRLDELSRVIVRDTLIPRINEVGPDLGSSMFLVCSTQKLTNNGLFRASLLPPCGVLASKRRTFMPRTDAPSAPASACCTPRSFPWSSPQMATLLTLFF